MPFLVKFQCKKLKYEIRIEVAKYKQKPQNKRNLNYSLKTF